MPLGDCVLPFITFTNIRTLLVIMGATMYYLVQLNIQIIVREAIWFPGSEMYYHYP